jgi:signal transduction histidine kinase
MTTRPLLVVAAVMALALAGALWFAHSGMGAPAMDVLALALLLPASGIGSLLVGAAAVGWARGNLPSLHLRLLIGYGFAVLVVFVVVIVTSMLMFLNAHDLMLLILLLTFSSAISLAFGYSVASGLAGDIGTLTRAARKLADGDWSARVRPTGRDEVSQLAVTFDQMANQLQRTFERERELEAARRDLIAGVSHDLRTPLATTRAMVESVLDEVVTDPDEVKRYLRLIQSDVALLSRLIDDLFELSQIEMGALRLEVAPVSLSEVIAETLEAYRVQAEENGVELDFRIDADLPPVAADAPRLQRVLRNLLDNAQRYTRPGGAIRVETRREGEAARVSVQDTGLGIAPADLERVFDRFYQGDAPPPPTGERRARGAGLGLAIARGLVEAHGGRIWAEVAVPTGTAFNFLIPFAASAAGDGRSGAPDRAGLAGSASPSLSA